MDISIRQAYYREACYLYSKTEHFVYKCSNQKTQIRVVFCAIISEERQVWVDKVRELNKSSAREKQLAKEAPLKEDFVEA